MRAAPASPPSSSSAARRAPAPGRPLPDLDTAAARTRLLTATTTFASRRPTTPAIRSHPQRSRCRSTTPRRRLRPPSRRAAEQRARHGQLQRRATARAPASAPPRTASTAAASSWATAVDRRRPGRPLERRLARGRSSSRPTTSATSRPSKSGHRRDRHDGAERCSGGDPGDYLRGIANLTYSTGAGDVSSVQFQFSPAGAGAWSNIGAADISPPYEAAWNTMLVADGPYDLRAVVTDSTGNVAYTLLPGLPKTVDNTAPSGSGHIARRGVVRLRHGQRSNANASDGAVPPASGVSAVRFEIKPSGSGSFSVFGTQTAPVVGSTYRQSLTTAGVRRTAPPTCASSSPTSPATRRPPLPRTDHVRQRRACRSRSNDPGAAVVRDDHTRSQHVRRHGADVTFRSAARPAPERRTTIATDSTPGQRLRRHLGRLARSPTALYELAPARLTSAGTPGRARADDARLDNTQPTGFVTAPSAGAIVGGPAVQLTAAARGQPARESCSVECQR